MQISPFDLYLLSQCRRAFKRVCDEKETVLTVEDGALCGSCFHCQIENNSGVLDSGRQIIAGIRGLEEGCEGLQLQIRRAVE